MNRLVFLGLIVSMGLSINTFAQTDSTGLPGDNFDLEGALYLFKNAKSLEDFEKQLNTESSDVNNLDLDQDGKIDYIRVIDNTSKRSHAIQLQIAVNSKENQDIAAILIESEKEGDAKLQMVGAASLYGEEKIIEPIDEKEIKRSNGPSTMLSPTMWVYVNVWSWPCVRYMYTPSYVVWVSPYYYSYYPVWWHPWHPVHYHHYHKRASRYHGWCNYTTVYYVNHAHSVYVSKYKQSPTVYQKYEVPRRNYATRNKATQSSGTPIRTKSAVNNEKIGGPRSTKPVNHQQTRENSEKPVNSPRVVNPTRNNTPQPRQQGTSPTKRATIQPKSGQNRSIQQPRQQPSRQPAPPRSQPRPTNGGSKGPRR
jgi:hypothetical protein